MSSDDDFRNYLDTQYISECKHKCLLNLTAIGIVLAGIIYLVINFGYNLFLLSKDPDVINTNLDIDKYLTIFQYLIIVFNQVLFVPVVLISYFYPHSREKFQAILDRYSGLYAIPYQAITSYLIQFIPGILWITKTINITVYRQIFSIQIGIIVFCWVTFILYRIFYAITDFTRPNYSVV